MITPQDAAEVDRGQAVKTTKDCLGRRCCHHRTVCTGDLQAAAALCPGPGAVLRPEGHGSLASPQDPPPAARKAQGTTDP